MVLSMAKPLLHRLFSRSQSIPLPTTEAMAQRGDAEAQFRLALKYANGHGAALDYAQAAYWYLKAADQSHSLAQFNLGIMYANGQGMSRDWAESAMWIRKAANLGDAGAQYYLGSSCHRDSLSGQPENASEARIEAYKWYRLAAAQGYKGSEMACEVVSLGMSREDLDEGARRMSAFIVREATQSEEAKS